MDSEESLIFVSIASYRDAQLVPTIASCLAMASYPELLRFGICWQRGPEEGPLPYAKDPRFRIQEVPWHASRGACWARAEVMRLWDGEDWYLQVDSHCRFAKDWDTKLLQAMVATGDAKPVLSTYAAPFVPADVEEPGSAEVLSGSALMIAYQSFTEDGLPKLKPAEFPRGVRPATPVPARFASAGFVFAPGFYVEEVPYDPELYFMGEEIAMTVRAWTHGYSIYHPAENIVWHDYERRDARRHWADHTEENRSVQKVERGWSQLDELSRSKVQRLLRGEPVGAFGLGEERTLAEYEAFAGVSFQHRKVQLYTVRGLPPPNPEPPVDWMERIYPWIAKVVVQRAELPEGALEDPAFWYVGIVDAEGYELTRIDVLPAQLEPLRGAEGELVLICEFDSEAPPAAWTLWPMTRGRGWLRRIVGRLGDEDYAVVAEE